MEVYSQPKPAPKSNWGDEQRFSVKQEVYGDNGNRRISSLIELNKEDLLKKAQEYRKSNIELLEKNRFLSQELQTFKRLLLQLEVKKSTVQFGDLPVSDQAQSKQLSNKDSEMNTTFFNDELKKGSPTEVNLFDTPCSCRAASKLEQVIIVNHMWQKDYNILKEDLLKTIAESEKYREQVQKLQKEIVDAQAKSSNHQFSTSLSNITFDDIEAFKQQMMLYKEDFEASQKVISKLQQDLSEMKIELNKSQEVIKKLNHKNSIAKDNFDRVNAENMHILTQLRKLSTTSQPFLKGSEEQNFPRSLSPSNSSHSLHNAYRSSSIQYVERDGAPKMSNLRPKKSI